MTYRLYYWDGLQGRGEFIRLALEEARAPYIEVARGADADGLGTKAMMAVLEHHRGPDRPFAPPFLQDGDLIVSQVANILQYLGPKLGLAPKQEHLRIAAHALQLTIGDFVAEVHETHHPISSSKYYEVQKDAAKARAGDFLLHRMPKYLGFFERALADGAGHSVGSLLSHVDLSLFQLVAGLRYAFPRATKKFPADFPGLVKLHDMVRERPNIANYLASERRLAFNESGIFRHYPELDRTAR